MSVTVAKAREIYTLLCDIEKKLEDTEEQAKTTKLTYNDLYNAMQDVFILVRDLGLPEDVEHAISVIHRLIIAMNSLRVAIIALDAATATTPVGWALVGLGFAASLVGSMASIGAATNMRRRW